MRPSAAMRSFAPYEPNNGRPAPAKAQVFCRLAFWAAAVSLLLAAPPWLRVAHAQDGGRGAFTVSAAVSVSQSFTDNRRLSDADKQWDAVTQVSPSVRISSRSGRVQGSLDYSLNAQVHANESYRGEVRNALASAFSVTAIDQQLWLDVRASISQQPLSAFGVQSATALPRDSNRGEIRTVSAGPTFRTQLGSQAQLEARLNWSRSSGGSAVNADSQTRLASARVFGQYGGMNWSLDVADTQTEYETGRDTGNRRYGLNLNYRPHYEWQFMFRLGRETESVRSLNSQTTSNWGTGATWTPTPRTQVNAQYDKRYFGDSYSLGITHRMARSVWSYIESRDANGGAASDRGLSYANSYDALFNQLAAQVPDPIQRDQQVRAMLAAQGGFTSRAATVDRRRTASMVLNGVRTSFTLSAYQNQSQRLDGSTTAVDDLSVAQRVRQHGLSAGASYRLSPVSSASLNFSSSSTGNSGAQAGNGLKTLTASYSNQLAQRVSLSLSLRRSVFDSVSQPYTESGGLASIGMQF